MQFELLHARGESLETLKLHENDAHQGNDAHHGEERHFDVHSENPQAAAFRLIEFVARFCWGINAFAKPSHGGGEEHSLAAIIRVDLLTQVCGGVGLLLLGISLFLRA